MSRPRTARRLRHGTLAVLAALLVLASASIATAGGGTGQDGVFKMLHTRGGTIGCQYASGGSLPQAVLRCDIKGGLHPRPPRPKSCAPSPDFDTVWAVGILLQTKARHRWSVPEIRRSAPEDSSSAAAHSGTRMASAATQPRHRPSSARTHTGTGSCSARSAGASSSPAATASRRSLPESPPVATHDPLGKVGRLAAVELTAAEVRVLGCLVEKEATTPDTYPLSTNGLLVACNQRSSRDPVVDYDEGTVTSTMVSLRERGLARTSRGEGSRVYKHAHSLREALGVGPGELALLSVLMLRGPQTVGELRTRTERQHEFPSLAAVDSALEQLAEQDPPLVEHLPRGPGQKEARWRHLLGEGDPVQAGEFVALTVHETVDIDSLASELSSLREELAALRARIDRLEESLP